MEPSISMLGCLIWFDDCQRTA